MIKKLKQRHRWTYALLCIAIAMVSACSSDSSTEDVTQDGINTDASSDAGNTDNASDAGNTTDTSTVDGSASSALTCEEIAAAFVTKGSANVDLADPEVSASCVDGTVVITSNQIPDFPYIETSPGAPREFALEYEIPAIPTVADSLTDVPVVGALGIAINGIPIFGAVEGTGGDVLSLAGGFTECGGHNGPTGYHYHTFDVTGSDFCLFSEAEAAAEPQLFGYAFDGYPIYSGNFQYRSSWYLSDESLFATDTLSAHTYVEGSGDLDQCNGRTDENGLYAYYTTEGYPYTLACYRGEVNISSGPGAGPRQ